MKKMIDSLSKAVRFVCAFTMTIICIAVFTQVIARFVFKSPIFWIEEFAIDLMIWVVFLGSAMAVANRSHTRITFFINLLPDTARRWMDVFTQTICFIFILYISYHSIDNVGATMKNLTTALQIPRGLLYISLPISGVMMGVYFLANIISDIHDILHGIPPESVEENSTQNGKGEQEL